MRRVAVTLVALILVLCGLAAAGGLAYLFFSVSGTETRPVVFIESPAHGQQAEVGQIVSVQALARDETKVTRVELWVDGALLTSQESSLACCIFLPAWGASQQTLSSATRPLPYVRGH